MALECNMRMRGVWNRRVVVVPDLIGVEKAKTVV